MIKHILGVFILLFFSQASAQNHSVARKWNEAVLEAIRNDFARPTVHARNLFHISAAMYDAWSAYEPSVESYLLGNRLNNFSCPFSGISFPDDLVSAQEEALSYACYRLMQYRFKDSPLSFETMLIINNLMDELGYDRFYTQTNLELGEPAALGNYIARCYIEYGLQDNANEEFDYENAFYSAVNDPIIPDNPGNPTLNNPNRWQPITLETFIDQSGNVIPGATPDFLGAEWGNVYPFALKDETMSTNQRDGFEYVIHHDPGIPPYLNSDGSEYSSEYQWGFSLVSIWQSHLDPSDSIMWDISPRRLGNNGTVDKLPVSWEQFRGFYDQINGGDSGVGRETNPFTGQGYVENRVPRGDFTRVLAEFWADGPDSETPPGHWFTILNTVNDHPELDKKWKGEGATLTDLEWDIKAYFTLGGAMHDAAITAWGIKGWYDYIRPISAIRYMAGQGQSSNPGDPNYSPMGIPLVPGYIELVEAGDALAEINSENIGKIKLYTWRGPDYIDDPETDVAGVGWILAENWWPFQRPTFITPNFAGYVSGHSTFSRAAAEILTYITGDEYFPGGIGEFIAKKNEFLVFEEGPSVDVKLQWATYRDASDQTSLSRIWGGIHPPADDIPGRIIGQKIASDAHHLAERYFSNNVTPRKNLGALTSFAVYPNPTSDILKISGMKIIDEVIVRNIMGQKILTFKSINSTEFTAPVNELSFGSYLLEIVSNNEAQKQIIIIQP